MFGSHVFVWGPGILTVYSWQRSGDYTWYQGLNWVGCIQGKLPVCWTVTLVPTCHTPVYILSVQKTIKHASL